MKTLFIMMAGFLLLPLPGTAWSSPPPPLELCLYECTEQQSYRFSADSWRQIGMLFETRAESAKQERRTLAQAIALMERDMSQQLVGDTRDENFAEDPENPFSNQDETRNTSRFIALLSDRGLLQWHVLRRSTERSSLFGPTHSTAVIQCTEDGRLYAVDASQTGFGEMPEITPLVDWKNNTTLKKLGTGIRSFISSDNTEDSRRETVNEAE